MERWISGASTAAVLADRPQQLLGWAEERQAPALQTPPRAHPARPRRRLQSGPSQGRTRQRAAPANSWGDRRRSWEIVGDDGEVVGDSAASCTSAVSSEVNEKARASMRVRLTVRTSESRSLHSARPIVRSGKSLSSMPNGPSSSMPTWSSPKSGEVRGDHVGSAEIREDAYLVEAEEAEGREDGDDGRPVAQVGREHERQSEDEEKLEDLEQLAVRQRQHRAVDLIDAAVAVAGGGAVSAASAVSASEGHQRIHQRGTRGATKGANGHR